MSMFNRRKLEDYFRWPPVIRWTVTVFMCYMHRFDQIETAIAELLRKNKKFEEEAQQKLTRKHERGPVPGARYRFAPRPTGLFKGYMQFSNYFMAYALIKNLLPMDTIGRMLNLSKPMQCYIPGRLAVWGFSRTLTILITLNHISWRLLQYVASYRVPSMLMFLCQDQEDIEKHYSETGVKSYESRDEMTDGDVILRTIMYYPYRQDTRLKHKLRPNRTLEAREILTKEFARMVVILLSAGSVIFPVVTVIVVYVIFVDIGYQDVYRSCSPEIDALEARGELNYFTMTLNWHRLYAIVADAVENFTILTDSGIAMTFILPSPIILNYDLVYYWQKLEAKIDAILHGLRVKQISMDLNHDSHHFLHDYRSLDPAYRDISKSSAVDDMYVEINDFLNQFRETDSITSDYISFFVVTIVTHQAIIYFLSQTVFREYDNVIYGLQTIQSIIFIVLSIVSSSLLSFHRRVVRSYVKICSIAALDRSYASVKSIRIMEHFSSKNCASYTLMHQYPYNTVTYLSIIAWSISGTLVIDNLFFSRSIRH